jgi:hypothetical protein
MVQWAVLLGVSALLGVATALWHPHRPSFVREILPADAVPVETARRWGGHVVWIDARGEQAWRRGHIDGALPLTESGWERELSAVHQMELAGRAIVVYGEKSASGEPERIARRLREVFPDAAVFTLAGGWSSWREERP